MEIGAMNKPVTTIPFRVNKSLRINQPLPLAILVLAGSLALASCSSLPPPTEQMAVARSAVNSAVSADATEFAPVEMRAAQDKLGGAEKAMVAEEYLTARNLAEEAEVDARLAERKARAAKVQGAVENAQEGIRVLREEMQRGGPNPQGAQPQ
jgi:hypothetical protein